MHSLFLAGVFQFFCSVRAQGKSLGRYHALDLDFASSYVPDSNMGICAMNNQGWDGVNLLFNNSADLSRILMHSQTSDELSGTKLGRSDHTTALLYVKRTKGADVFSNPNMDAKGMLDTAIPLILVARDTSRLGRQHLSCWAVDAPQAASPSQPPSEYGKYNYSVETHLPLLFYKASELLYLVWVATVFVSAALAALWALRSGTWTGVRCCCLLLLVFRRFQPCPYLNVV